MIRQDYLLRLIEEAAQMLAKLLGLQAAGKHAEALEVSRQAADRWLGLDTDQLRTMQDDELLDHLQRHGSIAEFPMRLGIAISLLKADADNSIASDRVEGAAATNAAVMGLLLRADILGITRELPEFTPRLADVMAGISFDALPERIVVLLMCRHEHIGQFGMAENVLHALRDLYPEAVWVHELGQQFYDRLLKRTNAELEFGNLPREEVKDELQKWNGG